MDRTLQLFLIGFGGAQSIMFFLKWTIEPTANGILVNAGSAIFCLGVCAVLGARK